MVRRLFAVLILGTAMSGCSLTLDGAKISGRDPANDSIEIKKGLFGASARIDTHKDSTLAATLQELSYDPSTGAYKLAGLDAHYAGNASEVIKADVEALKVIQQTLQFQVERDRAIGETIQKALAEGGNGAAKIIGAAIQPLLGAGLNIDGPLGKGGVNLGTGAPATPPPAPVTPGVGMAEPDEHILKKQTLAQNTR